MAAVTQRFSAAAPRGVLHVAVQAARDAARAWVIAPHVYRFIGYTNADNGGWRIRFRRQFRLGELLRLKFATAVDVFVASVKLGVAREVVIARYPNEGLLANLLHVLEVIRRVRPDTRVHVDWSITGAELAFRYGEKGHDVWGLLFRTVGPPSSTTAHRAVSRVDWAFWGKGKDHLTGRHLQMHREAYHSTVLQWIEITNRRVIGEVNEICSRHFAGRFCIGIHRRVGNAMVANLQRDGKIPSPESFIRLVESIMPVAAKGGVADYCIYLATDDREAVGAFSKAFGPKLVVREDVRRTTADGREVHFGEWGSLSITDAEDALIDAVLLSRCNVMVHTSSSVSTVASILNPALILIRA